MAYEKDSGGPKAVAPPRGEQKLAEDNHQGPQTKKAKRREREYAKHLRERDGER